MSIDRVRLTATVAGSAGSATGTATTGARPIFGRVRAVYVDYITQPATCDVTIKATGPDQTILTLTNANTDGWFYPRVLVDDTAGADLTAIYDAIPISGPLSVSVAGGDAGTVDVYVVVEC